MTETTSPTPCKCGMTPYITGNFEMGYKVFCPNTGCDLDAYATGSTEDEAIAAWNKRAATAPAPAAVPPMQQVLNLARSVEERVNAEGGEATVARIVALTIVAINAAAPPAPSASPAASTPDNPCLRKLRPDEPFFVLLGRDIHAAQAVRHWADQREAERGPSPKVDGARQIADQMDAYRSDGVSSASPASTEALTETAKRVETERDDARAALERDRTAVAGAVTGIRRAIASYSWLRDGSRGSYAYDDERYVEEFGRAITAIEVVVDRLDRIARDWTNCPPTQAEVDAARAAAPADGVVDILPAGHVVLEQADMLDGRVSQTVRHRDGSEYQRIVSADEAYGPDEEEATEAPKPDASDVAEALGRALPIGRTMTAGQLTDAINSAGAALAAARTKEG